jgi:hypothetical protein
MPYIPDWEPLSDAVKRIMASSVEESEAKADLCHTIADRKISVRVILAGGKGVFSGGNVAPPVHLDPKDLDWDNSRPRAPWKIGPALGQYGWLDDWKMEEITLVEVSTTEVIELLTAFSPQVQDEPSDDEIKQIILDIVTKDGSIPSQNNCADKVRERYPQVKRNKVRSIFVQLYPNMKQGRGSRNKCAD